MQEYNQKAYRSGELPDDSVFGDEPVLVTATTGQRFANLLVDVVVWIVLCWLFNRLMGALSVEATAYTIVREGGSFSINYNGYGILLFFAYLILLEGLTRGRTVGKLVTGTIAVTTDGHAIGWSEAALRAAVRVLPIEPFSAFGGRPWHDRWTNTLVIQK